MFLPPNQQLVLQQLRLQLRYFLMDIIGGFVVLHLVQRNYQIMLVVKVNTVFFLQNEGLSSFEGFESVTISRTDGILKTVSWWAIPAAALENLVKQITHM